jgi:hypothetical protein
VVGENMTFEQSESLLKERGVELIVLNDKKCVEMMVTFIKNNPKLWGEDIGMTPQQVLEKYKDMLSSTENYFLNAPKITSD